MLGAQLRSILDVVFPSRCGGCGGRGAPFCEDCWRDVAVLSLPGCRRCGRPLDRDVDSCDDCPPEPIAWCRSPFLYEGPVRRTLFRLKFSGWRSVARDLGPWMVAAVTGPGAPRYAGATVTWVPLGRRRRRARGYDQAEALARELAAGLGLPVERLLIRRRETPPQARRSGAERRSALRGAFVAGPRPPSDVLLVDDVLTSGATASECARALVDAGARRVGVVTVARALGRGVPGRCHGSRAAV